MEPQITRTDKGPSQSNVRSSSGYLEVNNTYNNSPVGIKASSSNLSKTKLLLKQVRISNGADLSNSNANMQANNQISGTEEQDIFKVRFVLYDSIWCFFLDLEVGQVRVGLVREKVIFKFKLSKRFLLQTKFINK